MPTDPPVVRTNPPAGHKIDVTLSELARECLARQISSGEWREDRRRDVDAAVALFIAANGDLKLSQIDQRACGAMTALFPKMPTRYGQMREDIAGGMPAILARGAELHAIWKTDAIAAERDLVPTVGFSATTHNKHLAWLRALFAFAKGNGYICPQIDLRDLRRKSKAKKGESGCLGP